MKAKQAMVGTEVLGKLVAVLVNQQLAFSLLDQKPSTPAWDKVYQFQIRLLHTKPLIWRRIQTRDMSLAQLHEVIQVSMGWENCHGYAFGIGQYKYGIMDELEPDLFRDASDVLLSEVLPQNGRRSNFTYEYDFGDGWLHQIVFEGCRKADESGAYPVCLEGEGACPPEDVGGPGGFEEFLEAIKDPGHEQHTDFREWAGNYDPASFDLKLVNKLLKKLGRSHR